MEFFTAVFDDGLARTIVEGHMASLSALGIKKDGNPTYRAEFENPVDERFPFHVLTNRTEVSEFQVGGMMPIENFSLFLDQVSGRLHTSLPREEAGGGWDGRSFHRAA